MPRVFLLAILLISVLPVNSFVCAVDKTEQILNNSKTLITQLSYVLSSQDKDKIYRFLNYYITDNAHFNNTVNLFTAIGENKELQQIFYKEYVDMGKQEYIEHLIDAATKPKNYLFKAEVEQIVQSINYNSAIINVRIKEIALEDIQTKKTGNKEKDKKPEDAQNHSAKIKLLANGSCNFAVTISSTVLPRITSGSCIEKLVIQ